MLHALSNGIKILPDASNAARDFTPYFTLLIIKILLFLRRPE